VKSNINEKTPNEIEVPMFLFNKIYPILGDHSKADVHQIIESFLSLSNCI